MGEAWVGGNDAGEALYLKWNFFSIWHFFLKPNSNLEEISDLVFLIHRVELQNASERFLAFGFWLWLGLSAKVCALGGSSSYHSCSLSQWVTGTVAPVIYCLLCYWPQLLIFPYKTAIYPWLYMAPNICIPITRVPVAFVFLSYFLSVSGERGTSFYIILINPTKAWIWFKTVPEN